jgi:hypothetical protein
MAQLPLNELFHQQQEAVTTNPHVSSGFVNNCEVKIWPSYEEMCHVLVKHTNQPIQHCGLNDEKWEKFLFEHLGKTNQWLFKQYKIYCQKGIPREYAIDYYLATTKESVDYVLSLVKEYYPETDEELFQWPAITNGRVWPLAITLHALTKKNNNNMDKIFIGAARLVPFGTYEQQTIISKYRLMVEKEDAKKEDEPSKKEKKNNNHDHHIWHM